MPAGRMMKKRWLKWVLIVAAGVIIVLLSALILVQMQAFNHLILNQARNYLHKSGIDLSASGIHLDLWNSAVTLDNVIVRSTAAPDLPPIFQASRIDTKLGIRNIIQGLLDFEDLKVARPEIYYLINPEGKSNLPDTGPSSGAAPKFLIARARLTDGSFRFEDIQKKTNIRMPRWQLSVDGDRITLDHHINFSTQQPASFKDPDLAIPVDSLQLIGNLRGMTFQIEQAKVLSSKSQITATGSVRDLSNPEFNLQIAPSLDMDGIARLLNSKERLSGWVSGTVAVSGGMQDLAFSAQVKGVHIAAGSYRNTSFDLNTRGRWNSGQLSLRDFDLRSPEGSLNGNADFYLGQQKGTNRIEANMRNLALSPVWKLIHPPFDFAARSTGTVALRWKGYLTLPRLDVDAHLNLAATRPEPGRMVLPVSGTLDARLHADRMTGNLKAFSVMGSTIDGPFSLLSFEGIEADLQGEIADIDSPLTQVPQFLGSPDHSLVGIPMRGPLGFKAKVSGKLENPTFVVTAQAPSLKIDTLPDLNAKVEATIHGALVAFESTASMLRDTTVLARGTLEIGEKGTILNLDAHTDRMPAEDVVSLLKGDLPATGTLTADLHLDGPIDSPKGNGTVTGSQLAIYDQPLGHLETNLQISGGEIRSNPFRITRDSLHPDADYINGAFRYRPSTDQFEFKASGQGLTWEPPALPGEKILEGTANLIASGSGTLAQPSIDLKLESKDIRAGQNSLGPVSIAATLRDERASIEALAPRLQMSSTAQVSARSPYPFSGQLQISHFDLSLAGLSVDDGQPLTGFIDGVVNGSGNLEQMQESQVSAQIRKIDLLAGDREVYTEGLIQAEYRDHSIELLTPATVVSGNSRLQIAGRIPLQNASSTGSLTARGQIDLTEAAGFVQAPEGFAAAGTLNLDFSLTGGIQNMKAAGSMTLDDGALLLPFIPVPISDIAIRANIMDGALVLQRAEGAVGEGRISLLGELPFGLLPKNMPVQFPRKEGPARFTFDLTKLKPEVTGLLPQGISGLVSVHATGEAASADLRALSAQITFNDLGLKINEIQLAQSGSSSILIREGIASIAKLLLTGTETSIEATGSAGLFPDGPLNLELSGNFNAALLAFIDENLKTEGKIKFHVAMGGDRRAPGLSGRAEMNGGRLTLQNPRVVADSLTMRVGLASNLISIQEFTGTLNGGSLKMDGSIGYQGGALNDFNLKLALRDVFLNFPEGLKSASNGTLTVKSSDDSIMIEGTVRILESSYREPFTFAGQLMSYLRSKGAVAEIKGPNPLLDRIRLNVALRTATPILVQNNIAKVEADANLTMVGTYGQPSLVGRVTLNQGGEIILNQRTYYTQRGTVTLSDQSQIKPELDIQAQTRVDPYDITVQLTGPPEKLVTSLSSEPALPESDVISLLLTGRLSSASTQQLARTQALSLIAGQASEEVAREARQALHLSTFGIDPGLIAPETDPGARLTIGKDIMKNVSVAYSMNLMNGGDQIWTAQYNITRGLTTQATKQQDNSNRFEFRHDLRLGGEPARRSSRTAASRFEIGSIHFEGAGATSDKILQDRFKVKPGEKYEFPKIQKGLDRLHDFYAGQKQLEADIRLHRETREDTVDLNVTINPGPVIDFVYDGMPLSSHIKEKVENAWRNGVFDAERLEEAITAIRRPLLQEGYLQSKIAHEVESGNDRRVIRFHITPGQQYAKVPVLFPGASGIRAVQLSDALSRANLTLDIYADPKRVAGYLKQYYRERGFLQAIVDLPQPDLDSANGKGEVSIPVHEGPLFTIGDLNFSGNSAFQPDRLRSALHVSSGNICSPSALQDAVRALENRYHDFGYNEVSVAYQVVEDSQTAHANVTFQITERRQSLIRDIQIEGNQETSADFIRRQLDFKTGDVLDFKKINETRRRLYSTGAYSSVDFQNEEVPGARPDSKEKGIRVHVRLREIKPYHLQYGLYYDTERGPGGLVEAQDANFLGRASALGIRLRYDSDLQEARLFYNQPFVTHNFLKMDLSASILHETRTAFSADRVGFSLFREKDLSKKFIFDYGYRYDHVRWNGVPPDPTLFQASVPVARLIGTVWRDTRDGILNASRGEFMSHSFEFGPQWLGSENGFARYYGQYFRYVPLDKYLGKSRYDEEGKPIAPSLVYAGALRLGLTGTFSGNTAAVPASTSGGESVIAPERFFAGGGTTMRGFQQDLLGPVVTLSDGTKRPLGGEGQFLFNNEIRFPIVGILHGVGFVDIGNVYPKLSDFNLNVRKSAGAGLRLLIKSIPLRFDYGIKLDRKPGESKGAFFFSIGQAF
jgi:outer membrane protein assembly complex protein YaeT